MSIFTKVVDWAKSVWLKVAVSALAAVLTFVLLKFVVGHLISVTIVDFAAAGVAAWLAWVHIALWEAKKVIAAAGSVVKKL